MRNLVSGIILVVLFGCQNAKKEEPNDWLGLQVSENGRFFQLENGDPFFWLGDTGWLIYKKLDRAQITKYLDDRQKKGYNVIQVMLMHNVEAETDWGVKALIDNDLSQPNIIAGDNPKDTTVYDYWDHVEYSIQEALKRNLWMGLVPVWGSPVHDDNVTPSQAREYTRFLYNRFGDYPNIIWLNGGDVRGDDHQEVWQVIGETLDSLDNEHLITFHPRGRTMSSEWFHNASWLDFNMFQSGHRNYEQDTASDSHRFGPDNWKYVDVEYNMNPIKPTLDGEPSYEDIPHGLHDSNNEYWGDSDLRRYAYWSVFAGGAGFTYGNNSIMQFYREKDGDNKAFGAREFWEEAIDSPGASQMVHLKKLMLEYSYFSRVPNQDLIIDQGERYDYLTGTSGKNYAMIYNYTGRTMKVNLTAIPGDAFQAIWFNPRDGSQTTVDQVKSAESQTFDPPGEEEDGNDWVLILKAV